MRNIDIIIGLPGSGKSYLLTRKYNNDNSIIFDDVQSHAVQDKSDFTYSKDYPKIISELQACEKDIVISDIGYCLFDNYSQVIEILQWWIEKHSLQYHINTYVYENNPDKCINNILKDTDRNTQARLAAIDRFTHHYNPSRYNGIIMAIIV